MADNKKIDLTLQKSLSKAKTVIGIDIGASSVNVAQSAIYKGKPVIIKALMEPYKAANDQEQKAAVKVALVKALADFDIKNADLICTIPNQKTVFDRFTMPLMPEAELPDAVKLEISNSKHYTLEDPVFDYKVAGRVTDKDVEKLDIRAAIAAKSAVESVLSYFRSADQEKPAANALQKFLQPQNVLKYNLARMIPISMALESVVKRAKPQKKETIVVLEIGSVSAELNIFKDGNLESSRKIAVTGSDFTKALTTALSTTLGKVELTLQEAESVKKEFGIPSAGEQFLIKDKITANQAISLLRPKLEQLIKEITRSFDFYYDKNRAGKLDRLILLGGGTMLKRLPEFLNAELGIPVVLGNSLQDIDLLYEGMLDTLPDKHRLTLAVGASLSELKGINLLPEQFRDAGKKFAYKILLGGGCAVFLLASVLVYASLLLQLGMIRQGSAKAEDDYKSLAPAITDVKNRFLIQNIANHRLDMGGVLRELSYLPDKVYLTGLILKDGDFALSGFVLEETRQAKKTLKPLIDALKKTSLHDVQIGSISNGSKDGLRTNFTIKAALGTGSVK